jgi:hypothetical protein
MVEKQESPKPTEDVIEYFWAHNPSGDLGDQHWALKLIY